MDFFKYDFKHTCFRLIISLIIGSIWIWFMSKLETNYRNDTTDFLLLSNILVIIIYPIFEIILFGYHNFRNQQNIWRHLKISFQNSNFIIYNIFHRIGHFNLLYY